MRILVELPECLREELKLPLGDVSAEVDGSRLTGRVVAVGDMVTYHLLGAGVEPDVAVVDGRTEREEVDDEVVERWRGLDTAARVENPAGTVTHGLVEALREALGGDKGEGGDGDGSGSLVEVDGEEDLAALPAVALAADGDTVVYGQPGEGMVYVGVDEASRGRVVDLLGRMDGDTEALRAALGLRNS